MLNDLTNLLPEDRIRKNRRTYFFRVGVVATWLLIILVLIHGVLLIPTYVYLTQQSGSRKFELQALSNAQASSTQNSAVSQLAALQSSATNLNQLGALPSASSAVRLVLAVPRAGITLTGFQYGASTGTTQSRQMVIRGIAATRESLHEYDVALQAMPWVTAVDLPISAYAQDANISFTITITGSFIGS